MSAMTYEHYASLRTPAPGQAHHRKIHYIGHVLQKRLLIALVALETITLSVAGAILYFRLNTIVDESLYCVFRGIVTGDFAEA